MLEGVGGKDLRPLADDCAQAARHGGVVAYAAVTTARRRSPSPSPPLVGRFNAVDLARAAVAAMGGQGAGGKPDFAQGGAPDGAQAEQGLAAVRARLETAPPTAKQGAGATLGA